MKDLLKKYEEKRPEIVFEWKDKESEAEGWVVINSLRGGAAGGGTRMRKGLDKREVESLAKTMEVKFTVSGPNIGGAKSGINFDPADPRKKEVLKRWFKAVTPLLKHYYGTGGDLNVDEIHEVIPFTENQGVWHPQEGVINGHFQARENERIQQIGQLRYGVSKIIENEKFSPDVDKKYRIADMITGYGVAESVKHFYNLWGSNISGKRAIIQGWGNVGAAAAYFLAQNGAKIVGIIDRVGGVINTEGYSFEEITVLFNNRSNNTLVADNLMSFEEINKEIWNTKAEIFIPAAASRLVQNHEVDQMVANGLEVIACGANVPFADPEIFFGPIMEYADKNLAVIPDFISNCGMARVFAYLMGNHVDMSDEAVFNDASKTIKTALERVRSTTDKWTGISEKAFEIALKELI
ncbi:Glu/Leu/Phe/Val dehydrogenase dimerization domain-containing protein [Pedobacter flavus]|uniref:Glu/Leu/Phe/Val dehydrogenase dimerization domain-containing protein n=1 Tax=Pedobacter flavus TaxID=3113906 RepID=A0ABU7GZI5_9SPHI|nr:Glu/Leu/Phe/Val dehydrogenase dimerization domain-containing protein [Pedobacter sp. VNH31]MEE1884429.1 Glu/Leu/Phe/Val dehydrogenase dimerization domain-containing protein [Pedobacter sp. VNH31]